MQTMHSFLFYHGFGQVGGLTVGYVWVRWNQCRFAQQIQCRQTSVKWELFEPKTKDIGSKDGMTQRNANLQMTLVVCSCLLYRFVQDGRIWQYHMVPPYASCLRRSDCSFRTWQLKSDWKDPKDRRGESVAERGALPKNFTNWKA